MNKVQIVYAIIASSENLFFQELWASVYSVRIYDQNRDIRILCDQPTYNYILKFPEFVKLVTEIKIIDVPEDYSPRLRSRLIKTTVREHISGPYLFMDTDTICAGSLEEIDNFTYNVAAVHEYHMPLKEYVFQNNVRQWVKNAFHIDITDKDSWYNSGVMFVSDTPFAHDFYKCWNKNWRYSAFKSNNPQDQPALLKTNRDFNYSVEELPNEYNCQVCMSVKYLANAKIFHFLHFDFPVDRSFHPFMTKEIYKEIKANGSITPIIGDMIKNVKSIYPSPSCVIGWKTLNFMMSPAEPIFEKIYNEGGAASWLMMKLANWLETIHKYTRKHK